MNVVSPTQRSLQSRSAMYNGYMPPAGPWALGMPVVPGPVAAQGPNSIETFWLEFCLKNSLRFHLILIHA